MKIMTDTGLNSFKFWSGAKDNKNRFSMDEIDTIEAILEDCYPDGIDETTLNDLFWFDTDTLCEWLDLDPEEWIERPDDYWENSWKN